MCTNVSCTKKLICYDFFSVFFIIILRNIILKPIALTKLCIKLNFKSIHPILTKIEVIKKLLNGIYKFRCNNCPANFINSIINEFRISEGITTNCSIRVFKFLFTADFSHKMFNCFDSNSTKLAFLNIKVS